MPEHVNCVCTKVCFQNHALDFVGTTTTIVGPHGEILHTIPAARTKIGTTPPGSMWTRNPIPDQHDQNLPPNFPPPVPGWAGHCCDEGCPDGCGDGKPADGRIWNIMDRVRVPSSIPAGDYLLSWRWDTEGTSKAFLRAVGNQSSSSSSSSSNSSMTNISCICAQSCHRYLLGRAAK